MKALAKTIIKDVLEKNNCESNINVVSLYLQAFTDLGPHYDVEEVAHDNGLDFKICEYINNSFNIRSVTLYS